LGLFFGNEDELKNQFIEKNNFFNNKENYIIENKFFDQEKFKNFNIFLN
jgi:hypothetical protein